MEFKSYKFGVFLLFFMFLVTLLPIFTSAITAAIGNGRMVLRPEVGETIEKYVLVINNNDVSVDINVFASGDLADKINVIDKSFTLQPDEEKKAYFKVEITDDTPSTSNINVQFTPEEGNGAGLSSTVVIIPETDSEEDQDNENEEDEEDENEEDEESIIDDYLDLGEETEDLDEEIIEEDSDNTLTITGNVISEGNNRTKLVGFLIFITLIAVLALVILMVFALKKLEIKPKKRSGKR